jgi:hypothetical protein
LDSEEKKEGRGHTFVAGLQHWCPPSDDIYKVLHQMSDLYISDSVVSLVWSVTRNLPLPLFTLTDCSWNRMAAHLNLTVSAAAQALKESP